MSLSTAHSHDFLGADHDRNARRTWIVIALTASMMVAEIVAGNIYGSMALVADGWHMSTHAAALLIAALAYLFARRHATDARFTFGTGRLGDLAGFASAIVLALIALLIGWESVLRLFAPVSISFPQAIAVAVIGLVVNLVSAWILHDNHQHHGHGHGHDHDHHHHHHDDAAHGHQRGHVKGRDNNLRAAYLHVLADALTSVLAIIALVAGSQFGWAWMDPAMGIVGALVIARWSWGLIRDSGTVLVDYLPRSVAVARSGAPRHRNRRRPDRRPACLAGRPRPPRRYRLDPQPCPAQPKRLQGQAGASRAAVACDDRGGGSGRLSGSPGRRRPR